MKNLHMLIMVYCILFTHYFCAMEITSCPSLYTHHKPLVKTMGNNSVFTILPRDVEKKIIRAMFNFSDEVSISISIDNAIKYYLNIKQH